MKPRFQVSLLISLLMATFSISFSAYATDMSAMPSAQELVGKTAPNFTLSDTHDKKHSLQDFKGKFVVLEWINFGCPFVGKHYDSGNMQNLQKQYTHKGVIWLSINSSAPGKQGNFTVEEANQLIKEKHANPSFYLQDSSGVVGKLYGAKTTPNMVVINPAGMVIYSGAIDDKPSTDQQDIPTAKNYVKQALDEAMAEKPIAITASKSYGCSVKY